MTIYYSAVARRAAKTPEIPEMAPRVRVFQDGGGQVLGNSTVKKIAKLEYGFKEPGDDDDLREEKILCNSTMQHFSSRAGRISYSTDRLSGTRYRYRYGMIPWD